MMTMNKSEESLRALMRSSVKCYGKHCPIVRYTITNTVELLCARKMRLLKLWDGHAEVLGGKSGSQALGWLSRKQVEAVERALRSKTKKPHPE